MTMHSLWQWKKSIFAFILLLCIYLFSFPLVTKAFDWYLREKCIECLGSEFSAEKYSWHAGGFVIENAKLSSKKAVEEGGYDIKAPHMHVLFDFSLWKRTIDLTITLQNPHFHFGKQCKKLLESLSLNKEKKPSLPFKSRLKVNKGLFVLCGNKNLELDLDLYFANKVCGNFAVAFNDAKNSTTEKMLEGKLHEDLDNKSIVEVAFDNSNIVSIFEALEFLPLKSPLKPLEGTVNGIVKFSIEEKDISLIAAKTEIVDFSAKDKKNTLKVKVPNIFFDWHNHEGRIVTDSKGKLFISSSKNGNIEFGSLQTEMNINKAGNGSLTCQGQGCYQGLDFECSFFAEKIAQDKNYFTVNLKGKNKEFISLNGMGNPFEKSFCHLIVKNFQKQEFDLLKFFLEKKYNPLSQIQMHNGSIDISLEATLSDGAFQQVGLDGIKAKDLAFTFIPTNIDVTVNSLEGKMNYPEFSSDETYSEGIIEVKGLHAKTEDAIVLLDNISTQLGITSHGDIKNAFAVGNFFGLQGRLNFSPKNAGKELSVDLEGNVLELVRFLPLDTSELVKKKCVGDKVKIIANGAKKAHVLEVGGVFKIFDDKKQKDYDLHFSFDLKTPKENYAIENKSLDNGKFHANGVSLNKFIAPFVFEREQFQLKGRGDLCGTFDQHTLAINYQAKNFCLESDSLCLDVPKHSIQDSKAKAFGSHCFNLTNGKHSGELFIENGEYFEKNSGLYFGKIHSKVFSDDSIIHLKDLTTTCCGLELGGEIRIDCKEPLEKNYGVSVLCQSMQGKFSALRFMLSHFNALKTVAQVPLEGDVSLGDQKWKLDFVFSPEHVSFFTNVEGLLTNGFNEPSNDNFSVENLSFKFFYDHTNNSLCFKNINCDVKLGPNKQPYFLNNGAITFLDFTKTKAEFDLPFYHKDKEVLRVNGATKQNLDGELEFYFDCVKSHIFHSHPSVCELSLDKYGHVNDVCIEIPFEISSIQNELSDFVTSGFFYSENFTKYFVHNLQNSSGSLLATIKYNNQHDQFLYEIKGQNCVFGNHEVDNFILSGNKKGSLWSIDKLQLDDLSIATDIFKENEKIIFRFLGFQLGDHLLVGMQGEYDTNNSLFDGYVNLLEGKVEHLKNIEPLKDLFEQLQLSGFLKASGPIQLKPMESWPYCKIEADLKTSLTNFSALGVKFLELHPFSIQVKSDGRIHLDTVQSSFNLPSSQIDKEDLYVGANFISLAGVEWDCITQAVQIENLQFSIAPQSLGFIIDKLQTFFPDSIDNNVAQAFATCKKDGPIEGKCFIDTHGTKNICRLELATGVYIWNDTSYEINNFALEYDIDNIRVVFNSYYKDHPLWCFVNIPTEDLSYGQVFLSDNFLTKASFGDIHNKALVIDWHKDIKTGFTISKAKGCFAGMKIDLAEDNSLPPCIDTIPLAGKISIDLQRAAKTFSVETRQGFADWNIGQKFDLTGRFEIKKSNKRSPDDTLYFSGFLTGENIQCNGYRFASLQAQVSYCFDYIDVTDIKIQDIAGDLQIPKATFIDKGFGLEVTIEKTYIKNLRPSLLCILETSDPLVITPLVMQIEINNLQGMLASAETFTASGVFSFNNRSKKTPHPLFAIPSEIIHRLGLNLSLLSPVSGIVFYNVSDKKIFLTKLKDVYSEGRFSKFYLDTRRYYSYIDFNGNIDIQIRMKQYNLLFKLAELFTVNVTGTLKDPHYSLKKQGQKTPKERRRLPKTYSYNDL